MNKEINEILSLLNSSSWSNEAKQIKDYITTLKQENERLSREKIQKELCESLLDECDAYNKYLQDKIDKAIKNIEKQKKKMFKNRNKIAMYILIKLENILTGGVEE